VILAHLSETNNSPAQAVATVREALRRCGRLGANAREHVRAASQRAPMGPVDSLSRRPHTREQLELSL
jgi:hypothetical protein